MSRGLGDVYKRQIHRHTAAELIVERVNAEKPNMGLTSWEKYPDGKIQKYDVSIAKNYLNLDEIESLERIVTMYLDYAEYQAGRNIPMTMQDWVVRLNRFLEFNEHEILHDNGKVTHEIAKAFAESLKKEENLHPVVVFEMETDDSWARDVAPTFLVNRTDGKISDLTAAGNGTAQTGDDVKNSQVRGVNWSFNAWGGEVDGLYASYEKDNAFAWNFCRKFEFDCYDAEPFVLEGGSIHSDGEGTLLVTESCLLSAGRNPSLTKEQIEEQLKCYLGVEKVLWLPRGIYQDETNEHVDNVCAFLRPGEVVLAWTNNQNDPQYAMSKASFEYLSSVRDAKARKLIIHKLPIPDIPVCITKEELEGYEFEEGEDVREVGERLAASYVNFYFSNNAVVMPVFGGENEESDLRAQQIMAKLCPDRKIIPVYARDILTGGGNIHCITQQIPL